MDPVKLEEIKQATRQLLRDAEAAGVVITVSLVSDARAPAMGQYAMVADFRPRRAPAVPVTRTFTLKDVQVSINGFPCVPFDDPDPFGEANREWKD